MDMFYSYVKLPEGAVFFATGDSPRKWRLDEISSNNNTTIMVMLKEFNQQELLMSCLFQGIGESLHLVLGAFGEVFLGCETPVESALGR